MNRTFARDLLRAGQCQIFCIRNKKLTMVRMDTGSFSVLYHRSVNRLPLSIFFILSMHFLSDARDVHS